MAKVVQTLLAGFAAYSMPRFVPQDTDVAPPTTDPQIVLSTLQHLKTERDQLRINLGKANKKWESAAVTLAEVVGRVKAYSDQETTERIFAGIQLDPNLEICHLADVVTAVMATVLDKADNQKVSINSIPAETDLFRQIREFADLESGLDAAIRQSERTLEGMFSLVPEAREVFSPAVRQIRSHLDRETPLSASSNRVFPLSRKVDVLSALEGVKQSVLHFDLFNTKEIFAGVTQAVSEVEASLLSLVHMKRVPEKEMLEIDNICASRVDLSFGSPHPDAIAALLSLVPQYERLTRKVALSYTESSDSLCDTLATAHKIGEFASESQRVLNEFGQTDVLNHRIHALQNQLLTLKVSLTATAEGMVSYTESLFQIMSEQETLKLDILKQGRELVLEEQERHSKTAAELQALTTEYIAIVGQFVNFGEGKQRISLVELIPRMPVHEEEIVRFAAEARKACGKVIENNPVLDPSLTADEFLYELLNKVEECLSPCKKSEEIEDVLRVSRSLKRHLTDGKTIKDTQIKRVIPWVQTKDAVLTALQLLSKSSSDRIR